MSLTWRRRGGGRQLKRRFATYKEARAWLAETRSHVGAGSFVRPQKVTLEQWVTDWLPILQTQVRPQTFDSYARNLRLHLLPTLGARPLQSVKPADLSTLYARLLTSGRADHAAGTGLSHRSVAYLATIVGKCLEAAMRGGLVQSNPARRPRSRRRPRPVASTSRCAPGRSRTSAASSSSPASTRIIRPGCCWRPPVCAGAKL